jgi:peptide/nickel transport system substrate-binding protein
MRFLPRVILSLIFVATAVIGTAAAADGVPAPDADFLMPYDNSRCDPARAGGTLRTIAYTPSRLNPLLSNEAISRDMHALINRPLCSQPPWAPERWMADAAESVRISPDWLTYTLTLRPGLTWGVPACAVAEEFAWLRQEVPCTSADVAFTLTTILDAGVDCPTLRGYYEDVAGVETPDARTVVVRWKRPLFSAIDATLGLTPLPRHIYGRNRDGSPIPPGQFAAVFNDHWFDALNGMVGIGEFSLASYVPDQEVRFVQRPGAWGRAHHAQELLWRLDLKQDEAQLVAFKNGQVHTDGVTPSQYRSQILERQEERFAALDPADPKAGRTGAFGWERIAARQFGYVGWNMRRPLFADRRVRQALTMALPKARIIREVYAGLGRPVLADVLLESEAYNRDLKPYPYDLKRARALLAEAGWADGDGDGLLERTVDGQRQEFSFTLTYSQHAPELDAALAIYRDELRKIGIALTTRTLEWKDLMRVYEDRDFDASVGAWRMSFDLNFHQLWHSSQADEPGGSNHCGFRNDRVDELSDRLRTLFDPTDRLAVAREIQAIIHEEQPYTFLWQAETIVTWQARPAPGQPREPGRYLSGVVEGLDGLHPLYAFRSLNGVWRIEP